MWFVMCVQLADRWFPIQRVSVSHALKINAKTFSSHNLYLKSAIGEMFGPLSTLINP